jgi:hypothetical protein
MRQLGDVAQAKDEKYESDRAANARSHKVTSAIE